MSQKTDWLPASREGILAMPMTGFQYTPAKANLNNPDSAMTDFLTLKQTAALETAKVIKNNWTGNNPAWDFTLYSGYRKEYL